MRLGWWLVCVLATSVASAEQPLDGYLPYVGYTARVRGLDGKSGAKVTSLGKSRGDRDLWLITLGRDKADQKPAWVIVGSVEPDHPAGGELALRMAEQIAAGADGAYAKLLDRITLYVIPRPDPDATEKCFAAPRRAPGGNGRATDDDRDFATGEDPFEDLDGEGWITQVRIADETGGYRAHPDDPRVLVSVDAKKNERGAYRVLTEGRDNDGDEKFNEDAADGVNFNRNFTFGYKNLQKGTGPNAVSEPESRALAEFLFDRVNVAGVITFTPEDNLFHPWKADGAKDKDKIRTKIATADANALELIVDSYKTTHGGKDCPSSPAGQGSFSDWAYFHYGRWSLAARAWWIPKVDEAKKDDEKKEDKRGADERNVLRWLEREKIDGFSPWKEIQHPDFPGKKAEAGGIRPFVLLNPPVKELDALAEKHVKFVAELTDRLPQLKFAEVKAEALGGGVYRVTATVINTGYLPTLSEMAEVTRTASPLQWELTAPKDTIWLTGRPRGSQARLEGSGGKAEKTWLLRIPGDVPPSLSLRLSAPAVGAAEVSIPLAK